jgi:hypothetical protein
MLQSQSLAQADSDEAQKEDEDRGDGRRQHYDDQIDNESDDPLRQYRFQQFRIDLRILGARRPSV